MVSTPINNIGFTFCPLNNPALESSKIKHLLLLILYFCIARLYGSESGLPLIQSLLDIMKSIDLSILIYLTISFATFLLQLVTIHIL